MPEKHFADFPAPEMPGDNNESKKRKPVVIDGVVYTPGDLEDERTRREQGQDTRK